MGRFFVQRLGVAVLVAITVSVIGFALLRVSGDLAADLAGEDATPAEVAEIAALYGLDRPLHEQSLSWAANALGGDLGQSLFTNEPVMDLILERVGVTILLSL